MRGRQKMGGWLGRVQRCTIQCTMDHAIGVVWCWSSKMRRGVWTRPMIQWDETVEGPGGTAIPIIKRKAENVRGSGVKWSAEAPLTWSPLLLPISIHHRLLTHLCAVCHVPPFPTCIYHPSMSHDFSLTIYQSICSSMYSNGTWTWWWCMWWNNHPTIQAQLWMMPPFFFWKNKRKKLPFIVEGPNESYWYPHIKIHLLYSYVTQLPLCFSIISLSFLSPFFIFLQVRVSNFSVFLFYFWWSEQGASKPHQQPKALDSCMKIDTW